MAELNVPTRKRWRLMTCLTAVAITCLTLVAIQV